MTMYNKKKKDISSIEKLLELAKNPEVLEMLKKLEQEEEESKDYKGRNAKRPLSHDEFTAIITNAINGFKYEKDGKISVFRPNKELALILTLEASLGLRISDTLNLTVDDIAKGKLEVYEKKTGKLAYREIPANIVNMVLNYAYDNNLAKKDRISTMSDRNVRGQLKIITEHLGYKSIGTHSFRKYFARAVIDMTGDIEMVRVLLNHSSIAITQQYIGVSQEKVDEVSSSMDFSDVFTSTIQKKEE